METPRPPTGRHYLFFFYLLLSLAQIITISKSQDVVVDASASGSSCTPDCGPGYECILGQCERQQCVSDCSGAERRTLCASDGQTYYSICELEKAKCELTIDIDIVYYGICITLPPAPEPLCRIHQRNYTEFSNTYEWVQKCIMTGLSKLRNGSLTLNDALECYKPQCDKHNDNYLIKQCSVVLQDHCWCSTPNGYPIEGTFQTGMPKDYCINRQKCEVNGSVYDDGEIFQPSNGCGRCECLDGNYTCFVEYNIAQGSDISDQDLNNFIDELIQIFRYQYNYGDHIQADIRHIRNFPVKVTDLQKETVLKWKFDHYNRNGDDSLNPSEEFIFHNEVSDFFHCPAIYTHLNELMDTDKDKKISLLEWKASFGLPSGTEEPVTEVAQPVKREAVLTPHKARKPLHLRKKFHYVLI